MVTRARLPTYDAATGSVRVRISTVHLSVLAGAKLLDTATTVLALEVASTQLAEAQPHTAALISRLGLLEGTLVFGALAVVGVGAVAEATGGLLATLERRLDLGPTRVPTSATAYVYYTGAAWFALLAVSNTWVLAEARGVVG